MADFFRVDNDVDVHPTVFWGIGGGSDVATCELLRAVHARVAQRQHAVYTAPLNSGGTALRDHPPWAAAKPASRVVLSMGAKYSIRQGGDVVYDAAATRAAGARRDFVSVRTLEGAERRRLWLEVTGIALAAGEEQEMDAACVDTTGVVHASASPRVRGGCTAGSRGSAAEGGEGSAGASREASSSTSSSAATRRAGDASGSPTDVDNAQLWDDVFHHDLVYIRQQRDANPRAEGARGARALADVMGVVIDVCIHRARLQRIIHWLLRGDADAFGGTRNLNPRDIEARAARPPWRLMAVDTGGDALASFFMVRAEGDMVLKGAADVEADAAPASPEHQPREENAHSGAATTNAALDPSAWRAADPFSDANELVPAAAPGEGGPPAPVLLRRGQWYVPLGRGIGDYSPHQYGVVNEARDEWTLALIAGACATAVVPWQLCVVGVGTDGETSIAGLGYAEAWLRDTYGLKQEVTLVAGGGVGGPAPGGSCVTPRKRTSIAGLLQSDHGWLRDMSPPQRSPPPSPSMLSTAPTSLADDFAEAIDACEAWRDPEMFRTLWFIQKAIRAGGSVPDGTPVLDSRRAAAHFAPDATGRDCYRCIPHAAVARPSPPPCGGDDSDAAPSPKRLRFDRGMSWGALSAGPPPTQPAAAPGADRRVVVCGWRGAKIPRRPSEASAGGAPLTKWPCVVPVDCARRVWLFDNASCRGILTRLVERIAAMEAEGVDEGVEKSGGA